MPACHTPERSPGSVVVHSTHPALAVCATLLSILLVPAGGSRAAAAEEVSEGQPILTFEKSIRLEGFVWRLGWAPDNRHLAVVALQAKPSLQVIDTGDDKASSRVVLEDPGEGPIAWSPDGQTIALTYWDGHSHGIRLASVRDARETARRETERADCEAYESPLIFTHDGSALWVTCQFSLPLIAPELFPVAIKYRLPDLVAEDRVVLQSPVTDTRAVSFQYSLTSSDSTQRLSAIIQYGIPRQYDPVEHQFAYGFDLGRKAQLFSPFKLDANRSGLHRAPKELILSPDASYGLVRFNTTTSSGQDPVDKTLDRLFEGYDTRAGQRLIAFGGQSGKEPEAGVIDRSVLLRDGQAIVGAWRRAAIHEGGLVVLDAHKGAVLQRIRFGEVQQPLALLLLALSPDGMRLASLTNQNEIRLYRIRQ